MSTTTNERDLEPLHRAADLGMSVPNAPGAPSETFIVDPEDTAFVFKNGVLSTDLTRRLEEYEKAKELRRDKYGHETPWGILGLYHQLTGIYIDFEWANGICFNRQKGRGHCGCWNDFDEHCRRDRPLLTYFLIVVCTAMMVIEVGMNGWEFEELKFNPMIGPSAATLIKLGAKQTSLIVERNEWWRLVCPMVLHAGLIHYVINVTALCFLGPGLEMNHGWFATALLFVIPSVGGNILSAIFLPDYITVGASGGLFGLLGAFLADIFVNWRLLFSKEIDQGQQAQQWRSYHICLFLFFDIVLQCTMGFTPMIDNFVHLGGLIYGFLIALITMKKIDLTFFGIPESFCSRQRRRCRPFCGSCIFFITPRRIFGLFTFVLLIMTTTMVLIETEDPSVMPCNQCRYISCVPFPLWKPHKWWYCDDCMMASASVHRDSITNFYVRMDLVCPNGEVEVIDLPPNTSDRASLGRDLPSFCRDYCDSVFRNP